MNALNMNGTASLPPKRHSPCRLRRTISGPMEARQLAPERGGFEGFSPREDDRQEWLLVQQVVAGDADSFRQLVSSHTVRLRRIARAVLRNEQDAEDALQDGLLSAYRKINSFEGRSRFSSWLTRIVVISALMIRRRHAQRETSLDAIFDHAPQFLDAISDLRLDPEQSYCAAEIAALIEKKLDELPHGLQEAFRLHEVNDIPLKRCAERLGVDSNAFKSRIIRARRRLANSLRPVLSTRIRQPERLCFKT